MVPIIWDADDLPSVLAALPAVTAPTKRGQRAARQQRRLSVEQQVIALRRDGKTWMEIAATVGLSFSRVRDLYAQQMGTADRPDDAAILGNLCAFIAQCQGRPSRRAYAVWPGRLISPATVENHFGSWTRALGMVQRATEEPYYVTT